VFRGIGGKSRWGAGGEGSCQSRCTTSYRGKAHSLLLISSDSLIMLRVAKAMNLSLLAVVTEYPAAVRKIKDAVEARLKAWFEEHQEGNSDLPLPLSRLEFNSVLLNRYRGGEDSQGWHSDNEAVYGRDPVIASVSFGCEREFCFRHCKDHKRKRSLVLEHGSLLLMFGPIQHHWQHCLPKRKKVQGERINLTFRQVVVGVGS